jgi:murein DD-endopeptidase MepM/ murein hydrolase activator NlpD
MRFKEFKLSEAPVPNPEVIKQQTMLKAKGYNLGTFGPNKDGIDGVMGKFTRDALDAYQKGIPPNKVVSPPSPAPSPATTNGDILPVNSEVIGPYGRMVTGPKGNKIQHPGVDMRAGEGTPIVAPQDGKIVYAAAAGTAGNLVELVTGAGEKHRFMHLSKILVQNGDVVKKGQRIGLAGNTGFSKGAHLHWEKYAGGKQVNPIA